MHNFSNLEKFSQNSMSCGNLSSLVFSSLLIKKTTAKISYKIDIDTIHYLNSFFNKSFHSIERQSYEVKNLTNLSTLWLFLYIISLQR